MRVQQFKLQFRRRLRQLRALFISTTMRKNSVFLAHKFQFVAFLHHQTIIALFFPHLIPNLEMKLIRSHLCSEMESRLLQALHKSNGTVGILKARIGRM